MKLLRRILFGLIFVNITWFFLATIFPSDLFEINLLRMGANSPLLVYGGEIYRLLAAAFLHANLAHLVFNMYALITLGQIVDTFYSESKLFVVYIVSAIAGNLLSYVLAVAAGGEALLTISVGASGAIFGLFGLLLGNQIFTNQLGRRIPLGRSQFFTVLGVNLLLGLILPSIDLSAHIGGLIMGLALSLWFKPGGKNSRSVDLVYVICIILFLVTLLNQVFGLLA